MSAPSSTLVAFPSNIEPTVGSFFLGAIASVGLTGVTTLQVWLYFQNYSHDFLSYKLLVFFVWALEIFRSSITIQAGYHYSVVHWGDREELMKPIWSMKLLIMLTNVIELAVRCFFIHKVWQTTYGRAKVLCGFIAFFMLTNFALGTAAYGTALPENDFVKILRGLPQHLATAALGCALAADWLITGSLVRFFRVNKDRFPRTNRLLKKMIFYAVNMGLLISITDVVVLVLSNIHWRTLNFYQLTVYEVVGNLYANSLLACLNARDMITEELQHHQDPSSTYNLSGSMGVVTTNRSHVIRIGRDASWSSTQELPESTGGFKSPRRSFSPIPPLHVALAV